MSLSNWVFVFRKRYTEKSQHFRLTSLIFPVPLSATRNFCHFLSRNICLAKQSQLEKELKILTMHQIIFFSWAIAALLPLTVSARGMGSLGRLGSSHDKTSYSCSADDSAAAIVPFANNDDWVSAMTECVRAMDDGNNYGLTCSPKDNHGVSLGPTFGFWMAETGKDQDPGDCYDQCSDCLIEGINNHRAVTTSCQTKTFYALGPAVKSTCNMGFDYGTMQANQKVFNTTG